MTIQPPPSSEPATVICGATAALCVCAPPPDHDGPHACGADTGKWTGTHGTDDFVVVEYPRFFVDEQLGLTR